MHCIKGAAASTLVACLMVLMPQQSAMPSAVKPCYHTLSFTVCMLLAIHCTKVVRVCPTLCYALQKPSWFEALLGSESQGAAHKDYWPPRKDCWCGKEALSRLCTCNNSPTCTSSGHLPLSAIAMHRTWQEILAKHCTSKSTQARQEDVATGTCLTTRGLHSD